VTQLGTLDTSIIFAYFLLLLAIGMYAGRRQESVEDYFIGGGRIGTFSLACLWAASWAGGAAIVGGTAKAFEFGISAGWFTISMVIGCLLFGLFLAKQVKRAGLQDNMLTYPDFIESRYDSRTRIVATITTIVAYVAFAAGQLAAAAAILQALLGWDYTAALMLASGIIVVYTTTGGFLAVTYTDWVQLLLLLGGVVFVGIPVAISKGGTWAAFTTGLPDAFFDLGGWGWSTILALLVSIPMSFFVAMDSFTKTFSARSEQVARRGVLLAGVLLLPLAVAAVWLGMTSAMLFPDAESSSILSTFILQEFPTGLKGLVLVGVLAALMSTADICILTASANITCDIYKRYVNSEVTPPKLLRMSMGASLVIGILAALMAWGMQDVIDILLFAFTVNSAALFIPTLAMVYMPGVSKGAAFWSITLSLVAVLTLYIGSFVSDLYVFSIDPLWPGLAVSIVVFATLSMKETKSA
jgi:SSS family solute:Na+ symporter